MKSIIILYRVVKPVVVSKKVQRINPNMKKIKSILLIK